MSIFRLYLTLLFLLPVSQTISASPPLYLVMEGYLWAWTPETGLQQLTSEGYIELHSLSPDGQTLAYTRYADRAFGLAQQAVPLSNSDPLVDTNEIWLWEMATGQTRQITLREGYQAARGTPAWSADNNLLMWYEYTHVENPGEWVEFEEIAYRAVTYDLTSGMMTIYDDLPLPFSDAGATSRLDIRPISNGFVIKGQMGQIGVNLYTLDGVLQDEIHLGWAYSDPPPYLLDFAPGIVAGETEYIRLILPENSICAFLDRTVLFPVPQRVQLISQTADPYGSLQLAYTAAEANNYPDHFSWEVSQRGHSMTTFTLPWRMQAGQFTNLTIAPDGQQIAYLEDSVGIHIWHTDEHRIIENTASATSLIWGVTGWHGSCGETPF